jgi:hypothetical protein
MFNPQARWDRSLPADAVEKSEPVEVVARFVKGKIIPLCFVLKENRCNISRINYSWTERKGKGLVYYFSVSDKSDDYRISLDVEVMSWRLLNE